MLRNELSKDAEMKEEKKEDGNDQDVADDMMAELEGLLSDAK